MHEDLADYYDDCFDADANEDNPYQDPMYSNLKEKNCRGCGSRTFFRPGEGYCESCADKRERGNF